jgi:urea transport system ATP-binding protein
MSLATHPSTDPAPAVEGPPVLELDDVQVGYGRSIVLPGASVTVAKDGVSAVMGHNGAGKSTLLRAAAGLLRPRSGSIRLHGEDITRRAPHERVARGLAYVPQGQQSFPHLTTLENLQLVADGRRNGKAATADALDLFPALKGLLERRAGLLSGGQRQQLAIARSLITEPSLLLLDEPTEGIQPSVVAEIEEKILALVARGGLSVLLVEQHVGFALRAAGQYYVLESGRITSSGPGGLDAEPAVRKALSV